MTRSNRNAGRQLKLLLLFLTIFFRVAFEVWVGGKDICLTCLFRVQNILIMIASPVQQNPIEFQDISFGMGSHLSGLHSHLNEIIVFLDDRKTYDGPCDVWRVSNRSRTGKTFNDLCLPCQARIGEMLIIV